MGITQLTLCTGRDILAVLQTTYAVKEDHGDKNHSGTTPEMVLGEQRKSFGARGTPQGEISGPSY